MFDEATPIYQQVAELIENQIISGELTAGDRVASTNEFAAFHRINPATAAKGVNLLVDKGILFKRRGLGMFVAADAHHALLDERRETFHQQYIVPLRREADKLGITPDQVRDMLAYDDPHANAGDHSPAGSHRPPADYRIADDHRPAPERS